jgi:hypothetical protein
MRTDNYNPSQFETAIAKAISASRHEIQRQLNGLKILEYQEEFQRDNPHITLHLEDEDGDKHELVIKIIQRPDTH